MPGQNLSLFVDMDYIQIQLHVFSAFGGVRPETHHYGYGPLGVPYIYWRPGIGENRRDPGVILPKWQMVGGTFVQM